MRGERQVTVRPLALSIETRGASHPTAQDVLRYSAVAMFAERAAEAVQHDFAVRHRCQRCPLWPSCAAGWTACHSPSSWSLPVSSFSRWPADPSHVRGPWLLSADGLRDVSARQKTLRGAIGWSYDLLSPTEQTLFTQMAVFTGGCTLEATEMACGVGRNGIASLLDKNLLLCESGLYGEFARRHA